VMLLTVLVIVLEIVFGRYHRWIEWISLFAAVSAIGTRARAHDSERVAAGQSVGLTGRAEQAGPRDLQGSHLLHRRDDDSARAATGRARPALEA